ncbi:unnamed protein product [Hymenolepis diminuta]|uniref:Abasic site processing protein HMCES n=1 Tax=Hymenolepis diminuta TaxID=6216 RepID=A0A3P6ZPZ3_HYMDI|nr:unnamed protein product [Hymenolepis diminuta]
MQAIFDAKRKFLWRSEGVPGEYKPSYNIAPGSYKFLFSPVVISSSQIHSKFNPSTDSETVQVMRWGLIPSFVPNALEQASSYKFATSNARAENILERPSYMDCIKHRRRCVAIAQGYIFRYSEAFVRFYEWRQENRKKMPYYISVAGENEPLMFMAGVFSVNEEQTLFSYSVITTGAVNEMAKVHDRMPVIFRDPEDIFEWIAPNLCSPISTVRYLQNLKEKLKTIELKIYPVTPLMNSTSFDSYQCIEPLDPSKPVVKNFPNTKKISEFFTRKRPNPADSENATNKEEGKSAIKEKLEDL